MESHLVDDLEGWKTSGASHCAAWMNLVIGVGMQSGWEYLRVGRKLRTLPILRALFRAGKLSWSKVRLISRVAEADNERILCHAALDASVSGVQRLFVIEKGLRNDEESFNTVRALLPENYRFRIVDAHGQDIHYRSEADINNGGTWSTVGSGDYTRVYCGEPVPDYCNARASGRQAHLFTCDAPAQYTINAHWVTNTPCH